MKVYNMTFLVFTITMIVLSGIFRKPRKECSFSFTETLSLRGVCALLIMLHHISQYLTTGVPDSIPVRVLAEFTSWGIPVVGIFFFMSGFGLIKSYIRKKDAYIDGFLQHRLGRIVLPCVLCMVFDASLIGGGNWCSPDHWWFIIAIVYEYLSFYINVLIFKQVRYVVLMQSINTLAYICLMICLGFSEYWYYSIPCVNVGMYFALFEGKIIKKFSVYPRMSMALLFPSFAAVCTINSIKVVKYRQISAK